MVKSQLKNTGEIKKNSSYVLGIYISQRNIGLIKKFVQAFPQHIMGKPK